MGRARGGRVGCCGGAVARSGSGGESDGAGDTHAHRGRGVEAVAFAAHRRDEVGSRGEFLAQATNVSIDGARVGSEVRVGPHGCEQFVAGDSAVGVSGQVCEEVVFFGGQSRIAPIESDLSAVDVNVDAGGAQTQAS